MKTKEVTHDLSDYVCQSCGFVNAEYFPWPVDGKCLNCGHAQLFGPKAIFRSMELLAEPEVQSALNAVLSA